MQAKTAVFRDKISARIFCVKAFKKNESFKFKSLSQSAPAKITRIISLRDSLDSALKPDFSRLEELDLAEIEMSTDHPVVAEQFCGTNSLGRFVLEDKDQEICAAGIVI